MPDLPKANEVIAICCSDIHLQHNPPPARAGEPDWYAAMAKPLHQLRDLMHQFHAPLIVAGDIGDHWLWRPELVSFAIRELPQCYAIPGQHDLPHHNYKDIKKSGYWTLVEAGVIKHLEYGQPKLIEGRLWAWAYPWGHEVAPRPHPAGPDTECKINLAVVHAFVWTQKNNTGYTGAPEDRLAGNYLAKLKGYDAAVFGDNHKGFKFHQIMNCGGLMRRRSDEGDRKPFAGLLMSDGSWQRAYLETTGEKHEHSSFTVQQELAPPAGLEDFLKQLKHLQETRLDYAAAVRDYIRDSSVDPAVQDLLIRAIA